MVHPESIMLLGWTEYAPAIDYITLLVLTSGRRDRSQ